MKVKASLIVSAVGILKSIDTTAMKLSTSYKVKTVMAACQLAIEDFEVKRVAIAEKHGTMSKDKTHYEFKKKGSQALFQKELAEILEDVIEMDVKKIHVDLLDDYIDIPPQNIELISWFVDGLDG
jgi:hypothetical protein